MKGVECQCFLVVGETLFYSFVFLEKEYIVVDIPFLSTVKNKKIKNHPFSLKKFDFFI
jgi:hypothetical protein